MTNIIELETDFEKYKSKMEAHFPAITKYLKNWQDKDTFFKDLDKLDNSNMRKEFYQLFGYPKKLLDVDKNNVNIMSSVIRFKGYPLSEINAIKNEMLFREYCTNKAIQDIPIKELFSALALQIKYLQADSKNEKELKELKEAFEEIHCLGALQDIQFVKVLREAYNSKEPKKVLEDYEKTIKYTSDKNSEFSKMWKRTRYFVDAFIDANTPSFIECLKYIPDMKLAEGVFNGAKDKDEQAMQELNKLVSILPYKKEEDKLDILTDLNNYMDKDIVKMLPQFKDKWENGRLCFEIGDTNKDLFNKYKGVMNTKYFVITVNPVDMLFCSTDQEYQSCFSLLSPHGSVKGLPNFISRKDVAMCFLSSGSMSKPWKSESYPGLSFGHIKIKARAFIYNDDKLKYADIGRCYSPCEISRASYGDLRHFRHSARILLWKFLSENGTVFSDLSSGINRKRITEFLTNGVFDRNAVDFKFNVAPLVKRIFKGSDNANEVYMDNLAFTSDNNTRYYDSNVGAGCCSRFCGCGDLGSLYRLGLQDLENSKAKKKEIRI